MKLLLYVTRGLGSGRGDVVFGVHGRLRKCFFVTLSLSSYMHPHTSSHPSKELNGWSVEEGAVNVTMSLLVKSNNHKVIVIGKGGEVIRRICGNAEKQLEGILGRPVTLKVNVKVSILGERVLLFKLNVPNIFLSLSLTGRLETRIQ